MPLSLLLTTSGLCAYYDNAADILLLDLKGHLTLATMQMIKNEVVQLAMHRPYAQVIINTYYLSGLEPAAQQQLKQALEPGLRLLGVQKLAWVCHLLPACMVLAHSMLTDLPLAASLFNDLEHAVSWLLACLGRADGGTYGYYSQRPVPSQGAPAGATNEPPASSVFLQK